MPGSVGTSGAMDSSAVLATRAESGRSGLALPALHGGAHDQEVSSSLSRDYQEEHFRLSAWKPRATGPAGRRTRSIRLTSDAPPLTPGSSTTFCRKFMMYNCTVQLYQYVSLSLPHICSGISEQLALYLSLCMSQATLGHQGSAPAGVYAN